jgi:hypothetical protein
VRKYRCPSLGSQVRWFTWLPMTDTAAQSSPLSRVHGRQATHSMSRPPSHCPNSPARHASLTPARPPALCLRLEAFRSSPTRCSSCTSLLCHSRLRISRQWTCSAPALEDIITYSLRRNPPPPHQHDYFYPMLRSIPPLHTPIDAGSP